MNLAFNNSSIQNGQEWNNKMKREKKNKNQLERNALRRRYNRTGKFYRRLNFFSSSSLCNGFQIQFTCTVYWSNYITSIFFFLLVPISFSASLTILLFCLYKITWPNLIHFESSQFSSFICLKKTNRNNCKLHWFLSNEIQVST